MFRTGYFGPAKIESMPAASTPAVQDAPLRSPWLTVALAWLVPGLGHFLLGRKGRAAIIFAAVVISFVIGLLMRGPMFQPSSTGDILTRLIEAAGFVGDLAAGAIYFIAVGFGYWPPDQPTHTADYGSKFLVAAGLMNILAMVDAYEIALREKE
jgi:hypothetical protein